MNPERVPPLMLTTHRRLRLTLAKNRGAPRPVETRGEMLPHDLHFSLRPRFSKVGGATLYQLPVSTVSCLQEGHYQRADPSNSEPGIHDRFPRAIHCCRGGCVFEQPFPIRLVHNSQLGNSCPIGVSSAIDRWTTAPFQQTQPDSLARRHHLIGRSFHVTINIHFESYTTLLASCNLSNSILTVTFLSW
jgi:hypothetical protein